MKKLIPIPQYEQILVILLKKKTKRGGGGGCVSRERKEKIIEHESGGDGALPGS